MTPDRVLALAHGPYPSVAAAGAWLDNAVAGIHGHEAHLSPVVGNLISPSACAAHEDAMQRLLAWLAPPALLAHDLHPDFHSTRYAQAWAANAGIPALPVQHHHAHIAAVCAEHGWHEPVLGIALDGVGLGTDGQAWGGELLHVDGAHFQRLGHFRPIGLPGGDTAAKEPWRVATAVLHALGRAEDARERFADQTGLATVLDMLDRDVRCPRTSSAGRVFDAAAGLLGLCLKMHKDAEAAQALEAAATRHIASHGWPEPMAGGWVIAPGQPGLTLDLLPLLVSLHAVPRQPELIDHAAARFHATLCAALCQWVEHASTVGTLRTVALGGGCFYNRLLASKLPDQLHQLGFRVLMPQRVPAGDAGLALGQAWIAAQTLKE